MLLTLSVLSAMRGKRGSHAVFAILTPKVSLVEADWGFVRPWGCWKSLHILFKLPFSANLQVFLRAVTKEEKQCFESDLPPQSPLSEESCKLERVVFPAFIFPELQSDQHFLVNISRLFHSVWQMIFFGQTDDEPKWTCVPCRTWNSPSSGSLSVNELSRLLNFQSLLKT